MIKLIKKYSLITIIILLGLFVKHGYCLDQGMHMAVARRTIEIWQNFDPVFWNYWNTVPHPDSHRWCWERDMVRKFYYIGTTLPDLFWEGQQTTVAELIAQLYDNRGSFNRLQNNRISVHTALYIEDQTYSLTRNRITFAGNNHHNISVLYRMASAVRNEPSNLSKALIYGAFMHAIEDLYGHMILQTSRYGYGFAIDDSSCVNDPILKMAETYHELFSGTHITNEDYSPITQLLFWGKIRSHDDPNVPWLHCFPTLEFYKEVHLGTYFGERGWQHMDIPPIHKFVEAANATGYATGNLTHARLRSYLHGWAIILGLGYGYWPNENPRYPGQYAGGVIGHPTWTPNFIIQDTGHLYTIITAHTVGSGLPAFFEEKGLA